MITAEEMYRLEKHASEATQRFRIKQIETDEAIDILTSSEKCCLYNITSLTHKRDNKFPKTSHPVFYTLDDLILYIEPAPRKETMNAVLRGMIIRDNFIKEEILFLKYLELLRKSIVSFYDLVVRNNPSVNFRSFPAISKHICSKYKEHREREESLLLLNLLSLTEEKKDIIRKKVMVGDIMVDPALSIWKFAKTKEDKPLHIADVLDGYVALLWLRSIILKTGKTVVTVHDLSFCKSVALVQMLIDAHKNFHELKTSFEKLLIEQYYHENNLTEKDNNHNQSHASEGSSIELEKQESSSLDELMRNKPTDIKHTDFAITEEEYDNLIQSCDNVLKPLAMGAYMTSQLPLFYRNLYTGKNSTISLVLSSLWDVAVNFFKMDEFENTPPLDTNYILYLLLKALNQNAEKYRRRSVMHRIYCRLNALNKEILPPLCEELYRVLHTPQIFYERLALSEINKTEKLPKFYKLVY